MRSRSRFPGPTGGQLVVVTHQDHAGPLEVDRTEHVPRECHIDHRDLVDHDDVGVDRIIDTVRKLLALEAQQPMNRSRRALDDLLEPLGGLARWRRQDDPQISRMIESCNRCNEVCLAGSGSTAHQYHVVAGRQNQRLSLPDIECRSLGLGNALDIRAPEVRVDAESGGEHLGEVAFHLDHARLRDQEHAADGHAVERLVLDELVQDLLDARAAVRSIHHQERVRERDQLHELDPAIAMVQSVGDAVNHAGSDPRRVVFAGTHLSRDEVHAPKPEAGNLPDQQVWVSLENRDHGIPELGDQRRHLVVRKPEARQPFEARVQRAHPEPLIAQRIELERRELGLAGDEPGEMFDDNIEVLAERIGNSQGLHRTDTLERWIGGQVARQSTTAKSLIELEALDLELQAELGVGIPRAVQDHRVVLTNHERPCERHRLRVVGSQPPGCERRARIEDRFHLTAHRDGLRSFGGDVLHRRAGHGRQIVWWYQHSRSSTNRHASWRSPQKITGTL